MENGGLKRRKRPMRKCSDPRDGLGRACGSVVQRRYPILNIRKRCNFHWMCLLDVNSGEEVLFGPIPLFYRWGNWGPGRWQSWDKKPCFLAWNRCPCPLTDWSDSAPIVPAFQLDPWPLCCLSEEGSMHILQKVPVCPDASLHTDPPFPSPTLPSSSQPEGLTPCALGSQLLF